MTTWLFIWILLNLESVNRGLSFRKKERDRKYFNIILALLFITFCIEAENQYFRSLMRHHTWRWSMDTGQCLIFFHLSITLRFQLNKIPDGISQKTTDILFIFLMPGSYLEQTILRCFWNNHTSIKIIRFFSKCINLINHNVPY